MDLNILRTWIAAKAQLLRHDAQGPNMVEYVLLLAFIAVFVFIIVKTLGSTISNLFSDADTSLNS